MSRQPRGPVRFHVRHHPVSASGQRGGLLQVVLDGRLEHNEARRLDLELRERQRRVQQVAS
jgi:hypothetical protein